MNKIAILIYDISLTGGAEKVGLGLANELSEYFEVTVISCFRTKNKSVVELNKKVNVCVLSDEMKSLSFHCMGIAKKLKNILLKQNIDVMINITAGVNTISYLAVKGTKTKTIYAEHSNLINKSYGKKHEFRQWLGAKKSDLVITLTNSDKEAFVKEFKIQNKCDYIHNWYEGVPSGEYNFNSKKIITVGRLEYVKGYDRLIEVAKIFFKKNQDWSWDVYGDGSLKEELNKKIIESGLGGKLVLKGNEPNIHNIYGDYAYYVLTSYFEGLPLVLLEAKMHYLPIISFDCPTGPSEIITDKIDGFLIKNGDIEAMAIAMNELSNNDDLRKKFSSNSTEILAKFDKDLIIKKWTDTIDKLIVERDNN